MVITRIAVGAVDFVDEPKTSGLPMAFFKFQKDPAAESERVEHAAFDILGGAFVSSILESIESARSACSSSSSSSTKAVARKDFADKHHVSALQSKSQTAGAIDIV